MSSLVSTLEPPDAADPPPIAPTGGRVKAVALARSSLAAKLVRYGAVSVIATTTSLLVLGTLVATRAMAPGWANLVATAVGTVPSFELNRRWVWKRTGPSSLMREIGPFCLLSLAGLVLSTFAVAAMAGIIDDRGIDGLARTLLVQAASLAAFGSLWVVQFLVLDRLLFRSRVATGPRR
jgi:putative flippase GtrA